MAERLNLVTGAMGFSGSYTVRELLKAGQKVIATDLARTCIDPEILAVHRAIGVELDHPNLEIIPADLLQQETLTELFRQPITHVFHTASLYDYSAPLEKLRRVNVQGTANLLRAMDGKPIEHFIHWSTCGVFGKPYTARDGEKVNIPFNEESSSPKTEPDGEEQPQGTHLVNAYSVSKWEQEQMMWRHRRKHGLPLTVIRPAPIYGPGSSYGHGGIILAIAHGLLPGVPADAKDYITTSVHVEDLARFALFVADRPETLGEDYNVVDNSIISYFEFLQYIALLTGRRIRAIPFLSLRRGLPIFKAGAQLWRWLERRFGIPRVRVYEVQSAPYASSSYWLSNRKSLAMGFEYRYADVREGIKDTVDWFRDMGWLTDRQRVFVVAPEGSKDQPGA